MIIRLNNLRRERVRDLFDEGSFNYTVKYHALLLMIDIKLFNAGIL